MDGYSAYSTGDYYDSTLSYDFSKEAEKRNTLISQEIKKAQGTMKIGFITPTNYQVSEELM